MRFLCSIKTFLNYVTDVYMYLRVVGAFLVVRHTLHFNTEHGKTLVQVLDLFGSVLVKKKSNRKCGVSLNESSWCLPILSEAVWSYASLLFFLPSVPWPRVAGRISHDTGEVCLSPCLCALRPAEELRHPEPSGPHSSERSHPASPGGREGLLQSLQPLFWAQRTHHHKHTLC